MILARRYRLRKKENIDKVLRDGKKLDLSFGFLKVLSNNFGFSRFSIIIGAKISKKAVIRNHLRRQISEIFRTNLEIIPKGIDVVIVANKKILDVNFREMKNEILNSFIKLGPSVNGKPVVSKTTTAGSSPAGPVE